MFGGDFNTKIFSLPGYPQNKQGGKFNKEIDNLPKSLVALKLSDSFNQSVSNLPLKKLDMYEANNFTGTLLFLPSSLTHLGVPRKYKDI